MGNTRKLKDWLTAYLKYTEYSEAPEHFHFWTGVGVIAAALRRKVWLDMGYFQWAPNFYIVLVGPAGIVTKSTTIGVGKGFLKQLPGIKFGPSAITWQSLIEELRKSSELVQLQDGTLIPMSCMSFFVSEIGTLLDFKDRQMIDVIVDLWDSPEGAWEKATKMFGREEVISPWLNIVAGTTPVWLSENLPRTMLGGGFVSRCIFVSALHKRHLVPYPQRCVTPDWMDKMRDDLLYDLEQISTLKGPFVMTTGAYEFGTKWYEKLYKQLINGSGEEMGSSAMAGFLARKQSHLHKLAMAICASRSNDLLLEECDLRVASAIIESVETELPEIFKSITTSEGMEKTNHLVAIVRSRGRIGLAELYQMFFHNVNTQEFRAMVDAAVTAGYITQVVYSNRMFLEIPGTNSASAGASQNTSSASAAP